VQILQLKKNFQLRKQKEKETFHRTVNRIGMALPPPGQDSCRKDRYVAALQEAPYRLLIFDRV
jgi:hypothetical protein